LCLSAPLGVGVRPA